MKKISIMVLVIMLANICIAQKKEPKFGKISKDEISLTFYEKDTSANAVILFKYGDGNFRWNNEEGFIYFFDFHIHIKILNNEGFDWANIEIP